MSQEDEKNGEREHNMGTTVERPSTPSQSLEQSLKEMASMRQGKTKKRSWKEFKAEINKEN